MWCQVEAKHRDAYKYGPDTQCERINDVSQWASISLLPHMLAFHSVTTTKQLRYASMLKHPWGELVATVLQPDETTKCLNKRQFAKTFSWNLSQSGNYCLQHESALANVSVSSVCNSSCYCQTQSNVDIMFSDTVCSFICLWSRLVPARNLTSLSAHSSHLVHHQHVMTTNV